MEYQNWYEFRMSVKGPERRAYHSTFVHNKKYPLSFSYLSRLYIYGGCGIEDGTLSTLWCLDTLKVEDLLPLPPDEESRRGSPVEWKRVDTVGTPYKPGPIAH